MITEDLAAVNLLFSMVAGIRPITKGEIILSLNKSEK